MNKAKIVVEKIIKDCGNCTFHEKMINDEDYDHMDYFCKHDSNNGYKFIKDDVELFTPIPIPDWCPIKVEESDYEDIERAG